MLLSYLEENLLHFLIRHWEQVALLIIESCCIGPAAIDTLSSKSKIGKRSHGTRYEIK